MKATVLTIGAFSFFAAVSAKPIVQRVYHEKRNLALEDGPTADTPEVWLDRNGNPVNIDTIPTATAEPEGTNLNDLEARATGSGELHWRPEPLGADTTEALDVDGPQETGFPWSWWNALVDRDETPDSSTGELEKDDEQSQHSERALEERAEFLRAGGNGMGIGYSPYNAQGLCKNQDEINADIARLRDYQTIRFYGVDCNQATTVMNAARANNKQVFAGIFDVNNMENELNTLISAARSSWGTVVAASIGNERINNGQNSASDMVNKINSARNKLRSAGYRGPVVTVDTVNAFLQSPEICHASDYCAVNCHPFFDPNTAAPNAGSFVNGQIELVRRAVGGGKRIVITETGWPHQGQTNGRAVPSKQNQQIAIQSLRDAFRGREGDLFLFSAYDDQWKKDSAYTFGAEHYWGIH